MGETSDQIEKHIVEQRNELGANISELKEKVKSAVDWRAQFQQRPMTMMGIAFGGGMLLSALIGGRSRSNSSRSAGDDSWNRNRYPEPIPGTFANTSGGSFFDTVGPREKSKVNETWENIKGALLGVAATKFRGYVEELVPGFEEHYHKCEASRASASSLSSASSAGSASGKTDGHEGWPESGKAYTAHS
ncbi:MAG TPA: hypothetical protein VOA41_09330 [Candidatus Dormibacteraeota bacterium]|nr:hypothetical protein [Candidatus Dormibacteraeota bacterium]